MNTMNFSVRPIKNLSGQNWDKTQSPDFTADSIHVYSVTASASPGFSVGILGSLHLLKFLDLRFIPTLSFGSRALDYGIKTVGLGGATGTDSTFIVHKKVNSTYITLPLLLKYRSWRKENYGAYFIGGINYSIDLAAIKLTKKGTIPGGIVLNSHDIGAEIGAGFDFYNNYFKLSIEAKMIYGLKNLVVDDGTLYSESLKSIHSKIFMLSFTFE